MKARAGWLAVLGLLLAPSIVHGDDIPHVATGPLLLHARPDLLDPPVLLEDGISLPIVASGPTLLGGIPGSGQTHAVKRLVTTWTLAAPDGRTWFASPDLAVSGRDSPWLLSLRPLAADPSYLAVAALLVALAGLALLAARRWGGTATTSGWRASLAALALACAAAGFLNAGAAGRFTTFDGDDYGYIESARALARGDGLAPTGYGMGWPILLAPLVRVVAMDGTPEEASLAVAPWAGTIVGPLTAIVVALIGAGLWGSRRRGLLAALAWTAWISLAQHPHVSWPAPPVRIKDLAAVASAPPRVELPPHVGRSVLARPWAGSPWALDHYYWSVRSGWSLMTDAPSTLFLLAGLGLGAAAARRLRGGRRAMWFAVAAGACLGWACAIRVSAALFVVGVGAGLGMAWLMATVLPWRESAARFVKLSLGILAGFLVAYAPQGFLVWKWTGSPLRTAFAMNEHYNENAVDPTWSLRRAFESGFDFYGSYHVALLVVASAGLLTTLVRRERDGRACAVLLAVVALSVLVPMASFAYTNAPERLILQSIPVLCLAAAGFGLRDPSWGSGLAIAGWMALLVAFVPGLPLPAELALPFPHAVYFVAPLVLAALLVLLRARDAITIAELVVLGSALVTCLIAGRWPALAFVGLAVVPLLAICGLPRRSLIAAAPH